MIFAAIQNVRFPYCKENQVNGDYTRTRAKKLSLLYKVTAKVPFTQLSEADSAIHTAGILACFKQATGEPDQSKGCPLSRSDRLAYSSVSPSPYFFPPLPGARPDRSPHSFFFELSDFLFPVIASRGACSGRLQEFSFLHFFARFCFSHPPPLPLA